MDVETFYHPAGERWRQKNARITQAKQICQRCPVISQCAAWALRTREPYGVWGGLSETERADILGVQSLKYPALAPRTTGSVGTWRHHQVVLPDSATATRPRR